MIFGTAARGAVCSRTTLREHLGARRPGSIVLNAVPVISVIDDDASIRAGINNLLRSLGYIVHLFPSTEAFLQSAQLTNTWCVISDVCDW